MGYPYIPFDNPRLGEFQMPFEPEKLKALKQGLWEYETSDSSAIVLAPGFFPCSILQQDHVVVINCGERKDILAAANEERGLIQLTILSSGRLVQ